MLSEFEVVSNLVQVTVNDTGMWKLVKIVCHSHGMGVGAFGHNAH